MSPRPNLRSWPPGLRPLRRLAFAAALAAGLVLAGATLGGCTHGKKSAKPAVATAESLPASTSQAAVPSTPAEPESTAPAETAIAALSPAEYQRALTTQGKKIRRALDRIAGARAYTALAKRVTRAEAVIGRAAATLGGLVPPEDVARPHERLVESLRQLGAGIGKAAAAVSEQELCAASSVLVRLGRLPARSSLRLATRRLAAAGYELASIVPKAVPGQTRRLATGDFVFVEARSGFGTLSVENGLDVDGVVVLTQGKTPVTSMYVRHNDVGLIGGIPDGTYKAYFTLGMDWDGELRRFTRDCSFSRFDDPMAFETVSSGGSIQYRTYSVTLHAVAGGTASTSGVAPDSFPGD